MADAAALIIAVVRKEITAQQAVQKLDAMKKRCVIGLGGVCITHGQPVKDCT